MQIIPHTIQDVPIAEITADELLITSAEDGLELLGNLYYQGFDRVILYTQNITPDFFDLKNGMAGEILQKFSNYRVRLAIVGDFSEYPGQSLKDFLYESNKGRHVNFLPTLAEALSQLSKI